jgi:hypothetical protein
VIALKDVVLPRSFVGYIVAAGYSQVVNNQPNYGVDRGAFGERLAAAAVRGASEDLLAGAVLAPKMHEDPRYYVEGRSYSPVHRAFYAITRTLVTRRDDGRDTINGSVLIGYAMGSALTNAYYPAENRSFHDTALTYGGALGGAAVGNLLSEFADSIVQRVRLELRP